LRQNLSDQERAKRGAAGRFHYEWATDGEGRSNLVRGQVQREVEGGNEGARADRNAFPETLIPSRPGGDIQWLDFSRQPRRFFRSDPEGVDQSANLSLGIFDGLAGLDTEQECQFIEA